MGKCFHLIKNLTGDKLFPLGTAGLSRRWDFFPVGDVFLAFVLTTLGGDFVFAGVRVSLLSLEIAEKCIDLL